MRIAIVAIMLVHTAAAAATHTAPGVRITYDRISPIDADHAKLRIVLATISIDMREAWVVVPIPARFVVTGLSLSMTGAAEMPAHLQAVADAHATYDRVVALIKDPALVEWIDDRHVMVHVFPVTRDASATVTLELAAGSDQPHVDQDTSLLATPTTAPRDDDDIDPYADYWPDHADPRS
jgi:hypothetical protein